MGLNKEQKRAVSVATDPKVKKVFITGIGGSGKSHVIREIIDQYNAEELITLAPTHSAARLIGGQTIHGFFKIAMQLDTEAKTESEALGCNLRDADFENAEGKVIIIDEVSMLGEDMLDDIISKMPVRKLILVGDPMQLSPVKGKAVDWSKFCDVTVELIQNYRTSNKAVMKAISHFRENQDNTVLDMLPVVEDYYALTLRSDTVCIAHKNSTLSEMQQELLGYTGAQMGDEVLTFGTATEHFVLIKDRDGKEKLSPYYVNGDVMKVTSGAVKHFAPNLYSVSAVNVEYMNKEPINKNKKYPKPVELLIGDYDAYKKMLERLFKTAQNFAKQMVHQYGDGMNVRAATLVHKFSESDRKEWGSVWYEYMNFKSKSYARHKQFVTSYKIQGRSAEDVIIHWDDLPSSDHRYVALSRAIESIQILSSL